MKILCICEHGNVRSVALAYLLKTIYKYDVLACGMRETSDATKCMLFNWADRIIALDRDIYEEIKDSHLLYRSLEVLDVGKDVWFNPKDQELQHKLLKKLTKLDL